MANPDTKRRTGRNPASQLKHPARRRMLRYLHRCNEPKGALEIAAEIGVPIEQIRYHLHALESYGTTRKAGSDPGGEDSQLYESAVSDDAEILAMLESSEADDETGDRKAA